MQGNYIKRPEGNKIDEKLLFIEKNINNINEVSKAKLYVQTYCDTIILTKGIKSLIKDNNESLTSHDLYTLNDISNMCIMLSMATEKLLEENYINHTKIITPEDYASLQIKLDTIKSRLQKECELQCKQKNTALLINNSHVTSFIISIIQNKVKEL